MYRYVVLFALLLLPATVLAQDVTGSISGSVTDPAKAAIVGATVTIISEETGAKFNQTTNTEGSFTFTGVRPGFYSVAVENSGFKKFEKHHFELTPGDKASIGNMAMEVGSVQQTIEVVAEGSQIQTATSELS